MASVVLERVRKMVMTADRRCGGCGKRLIPIEVCNMPNSDTALQTAIEPWEHYRSPDGRESLCIVCWGDRFTVMPRATAVPDRPREECEAEEMETECEL